LKRRKRKTIILIGWPGKQHTNYYQKKEIMPERSAQWVDEDDEEFEVGILLII
jgi:hypothetical protein